MIVDNIWPSTTNTCLIENFECLYGVLWASLFFIFNQTILCHHPVGWIEVPVFWAPLWRSLPWLQASLGHRPCTSCRYHLRAVSWHRKEGNFGKMYEHVWVEQPRWGKHNVTKDLNLPFNILKLNELIVSAMQVALSYDVEFSTTRVIHVTWGNVIVNNAAMLANSRTSRWRGVLQFLGAERDATTYEEASSSCERGQILCGW